MTRTILGLTFIALVACSCGDDDGTVPEPDLGTGADAAVPGVAADVRYQLACPVDPSETGCGSASPPVDVLGFDGEDVEGLGTITATCTAVDSAGSKNVTFSIGYASDPLLTVRDLVISPDGGPSLGSSCVVEVQQDGISYGGTTYGRCGNAAPSVDQPCQLSSFTYDEFGEFGPELVTTLLCRNLRSPSAPSDTARDITFPMSPSMPAQIKLINCEGF